MGVEGVDLAESSKEIIADEAKVGEEEIALENFVDCVEAQGVVILVEDLVVHQVDQVIRLMKQRSPNWVLEKRFSEHFSLCFTVSYAYRLLY